MNTGYPSRSHSFSTAAMSMFSPMAFSDKKSALVFDRVSVMLVLHFTTPVHGWGMVNFFIFGYQFTMLVLSIILFSPLIYRTPQRRHSSPNPYYYSPRHPTDEPYKKSKYGKAEVPIHFIHIRSPSLTVIYSSRRYF